MSIGAAIRRHCRAGRLFPLAMRDPSHPVRRGLYFSTEMVDLMQGPWIAEDGDERVNRLHSDFESFVKGDPVAMCLMPHRAGQATFGRLAEPREEVWDFRTRSGLPVMRIFGRFPMPGTFIAFNWAPRIESWNGREPLGNKHDPRWEAAKTSCISKWNTLFPNHAPVHGDDVHAYIPDEYAFDILSP